MRKTPFFILALTTAILIPAIQQLRAAPQSIDGIISDSMCGKEHMLPGKTDAQCIQECVKSGSSYALVLLCYKHPRRQHGQRGSERARWVAIWRRSVAMD
jgi:hypothetical protein